MPERKIFRIAVDECTNDKLLALQEIYKQKYNKFIPLGKLINMILTIPNFLKELKGA